MLGAAVETATLDEGALADDDEEMPQVEADDGSNALGGAGGKSPVRKTARRGSKKKKGGKQKEMTGNERGASSKA